LISDSQKQDLIQHLVLRIYPGNDARDKSQREYDGLQVLYRAGYPVPQVFALEHDNSPFEGRPFLLMERITGEMMWPVLDRSQPDRAAELITQFCELFVQLHNLDWRVFVSAQDHLCYQEPYVFIDAFLNQLQAVAKPFPELNDFLPVIDWLSDQRDQVPCLHPAPVHWDFHPNNVILKPDGSAVVIDWTQIQVSDPRFDLGWTLLLVGIYNDQNIRDLILTEYQRIAGITVAQLPYFDVASCVKRLGTVMISISAGADSMGMRSDAVAMMRRDFPALQKVYDLMIDHTGIRVPVVERLLSS
jgi:aminoglycoside phosphotransferase (APT) family kinase protein